MGSFFHAISNCTLPSTKMEKLSHFDSRHDVKEAENLLRGRKGTAIGDKGYCSQQLKTRLAKTALRLIAHARKNMKKGETRQKKIQLLCRRNLVERVISKLKRHIGEFSRFRAWGAVQATITLGILTLIYGLLNFATGISFIFCHPRCHSAISQSGSKQMEKW
jgi:hypothetical protein